MPRGQRLRCAPPPPCGRVGRVAAESGRRLLADLSGVIGPGWLRQGDFASVVVSSLEEINGFIRDTVHQPVFLADTTRPAACQHISKRLRLSQPLEWISHHCLDQIQHSDRGAAFGFDPKTEVLPELRLKDRDPLRISLHLKSLDADPPPFQAWYALAPLVATPIGDAARSVATVTGVPFR